MCTILGTGSPCRRAAAMIVRVRPPRGLPTPAVGKRSSPRRGTTRYSIVAPLLPPIDEVMRAHTPRRVHEPSRRQSVRSLDRHTGPRHGARLPDPAGEVVRLERFDLYSPDRRQWRLSGDDVGLLSDSAGEDSDGSDQRDLSERPHRGGCLLAGCPEPGLQGAHAVPGLRHGPLQRTLLERGDAPVRGGRSRRLPDERRHPRAADPCAEHDGAHALHRRGTRRAAEGRGAAVAGPAGKYHLRGSLPAGHHHNRRHVYLHRLPGPSRHPRQYRNLLR